ncbi:exodeoxyribonuclease V subunit gamma [Thalassotalea nanhaiensis]|uniref:RecBCD enzyme subunit RecC n=1 Tax=Thalassotalea nanhaiensis TaxID=3065648 RepID=A0ABY9TP76_9GAMM|nr:exodeoxyribonuclease V subunit gamma [Colwelliaceae bacterium SQ345]
MINIYPANRMEDLLTLFDEVQKVSTLPVLSKEVVLVQNPGMQHWLNMQQAQISGISMNASFVLPAQFLWQQLRILSGDDIPDQTPYSREVLAWRIDALLQSTEVLNNKDCLQANQYWHKNNSPDSLKRFQLAVQTADLFEQYLIYRPDWLDSWAKGETVTSFDSSAQQQEKWQSFLWYLLHKQSPYNPNTLIATAKNNLLTYKHLLPKRVSIFGINALAPMWIDFLNALSTHIEVHFYHLNPCYEYWGDIKTDKANAKQAYLAQVAKWPEDALHNDSANPLLANLGQQGREFLSLLHSGDTIEIPLFDELFDHSNLSDETDPINKPSVLLQLQKDILTLTDKRDEPVVSIDNSITITSAHSALREVQGLHDYLLHLFNEDSSLTPKDILVMCPQIEQYAPYIDSVFVRGWDEIGEAVPPLPCSIADRVSKDSEPLVAAFSELLCMPDSRFGVNQILSYLRLLPLQMRFGLSEHDIELITDWLDKANVHWGLDAEHKNRLLATQQSTAQFTWQQGLERLLKGFAFGDSTSLYADDMVLPWVEGNNALILGKLLLLCEQLKQMSVSLTKPKTAEQWQQSLQNFIERLFLGEETDNGLVIINQAISSLALYCKEAGYTGNIELAVVREYLNQHFSQPDPGRQFMIGQITFCSMLPMRSIPFKVLAVLGLNDGEFPRQRQPLGFDLMSMTKVLPGDRSRRGDDRYLFLEALISARDNLYLSYQGFDIKNNNERQPSIVLRELMDYLSCGYGWDFKQAEQPTQSQLRQLPLQVFSLDNFSEVNPYKSFDDKWLKLAKVSGECIQNDYAEQLLPLPEEQVLELSLVQINRFLTNPAQVFAEQRLKLFFNKNEQNIDDAEPFTFSHLDKYLFQQNVLVEDIAQRRDIQSCDLYQQALLSGDFPDNPLFAQELSDWQVTMHNFSKAVYGNMQTTLDSQGSIEPLLSNLEQSIQLNPCDEVLGEIVVMDPALTWQISAEITLYQTANNLVHFSYRPAKVKAKDLSQLYLNHLLLCALCPSDKEVSSLGYYLNEKDNKLQMVSFNYIDGAKAQLSKILAYYQLSLTKPLLLNSIIADKLFWKSGKGGGKFIEPEFNQAQLTKLWQDGYNIDGLESDPYLHYIWKECPNLQEFSQGFTDIYQTLYLNLSITEQELNASETSTTEVSYE